jgi:two-component system, cell cycle response regulator DivK
LEAIVSDKKKIIIIDDDPDIVTFLKVFLEDNGYSTMTAKDGVEGLALAQKSPPDLICLDITMPEKSGVKFYREVRADPALQKIPVVMVTGVMEEFQKFISTRRQVPPPDGYITKPIDQAKLLETIQKLLSSS